MDSSGLATDFSIAFFPKLFKPTTTLMHLDIAPNLGYLGHKTHDVIKKDFGTKYLPLLWIPSLPSMPDSKLDRTDSCS
jgi:hypothetical protein